MTIKDSGFLFGGVKVLADDSMLPGVVEYRFANIQPSLFDLAPKQIRATPRRSQHPLGLDLKEGIRLKNEGHERAVTPRQEAVRDARDVAVSVAREKGDVTFDDVYERMIRLGLNPKALGPAAGALFRTHEFVFTGEWRKSPRTTNHARMNRVWRLA